MRWLVLLTALVLHWQQQVAAADRSFKVINRCSFTIWPALFSNPNSPVPSHKTGWSQAPGTTEEVNIPENWSGRLWGRTQCDFSGDRAATPATSCSTGGCNGGLECRTADGTGVPPATLGEWTLSGAGTADWYDVSNVDGFNLPMIITPSTKDCRVCSCPRDLNAGCPDDALKVKDAQGKTVGCKTACTAGIGDVAANCCSGPQHDRPETCPVANIDFYAYFKTGCPDAYAYAYDEASQIALFTCPAAKQAGYDIQFCGGGGESQQPASPASSTPREGASSSPLSSRPAQTGSPATSATPASSSTSPSSSKASTESTAPSSTAPQPSSSVDDPSSQVEESETSQETQAADLDLVSDTTSTTNTSENSNGSIVGVSVLLLGIVIVAAVLLVRRRRRHRPKQELPAPSEEESPLVSSSSDGYSDDEGQRPIRYSRKQF